MWLFNVHNDSMFYDKPLQKPLTLFPSWFKITTPSLGLLFANNYQTWWWWIIYILNVWTKENKCLNYENNRFPKIFELKVSHFCKVKIVLLRKFVGISFEIILPSKMVGYSSIVNQLLLIKTSQVNFHDTLFTLT